MQFLGFLEEAHHLAGNGTPKGVQTKERKAAGLQYQRKRLPLKDEEARKGKRVCLPFLYRFRRRLLARHPRS